MIKRFLIKIIVMVQKIFKKSPVKQGCIESIYAILLWQNKLTAYEHESRISQISDIKATVLNEKERIGLIIDRGGICILKENFLKMSIEYLEASGYTVKKKSVKQVEADAKRRKKNKSI